MISEASKSDCIEYMNGFPDKFFCLAIVDPIYGHDITGGRNSENGWGKKEFWEKASHEWNTKKTGPEYFTELFRVSKNQIVWGGNYFVLPPSEGWIIWDKGQRNFSLADCEMAWTSFERATRIFEYARALSNFKEVRMHPTQKPTALYSYCLNNYAAEGDKILDTHLGSGSSRIAAYKLGFDFWGCEIDKDYFEAQEKRFKEAINEPLFQTQPERIQAKLL